MLTLKTSSLCTLGIFLLFGVTIGATKPQDNKAVLAKEANAILKKYCFQCHGLNGQAIKNIFVLDHARLIKDKMVIPGDARSPLLQQIVSRAMPMSYDGPAPKLTEAEIGTLRKWIAAGAPAVSEEEGKANRVFLTEKMLTQHIEADLNRAPERRRPYLRYYSIAHLYNAGVPEEELEGYRVGLSKLLNSLSWNPEIIKPTAIDPQKVLLRIDLRDYRWTLETWKTILATYPYGIRTAASNHITALSGTTLPYIRADWFVANASLPPLYHEILYVDYSNGQRQEIDTITGLEKRLGVNVANNLEQERNVIRGGVRNSGVSKNNRVVERHVTGYGAYWRSYDFSKSTGEQNIFTDPLGFKPAGGEMIFHLPNGMQGYFITDADGKRLDKAPVEIVSDRNYPDEAEVRNGRSCMSCHFGGMKPFKDQVRSAVATLATASFDRDKALALYVEQSETEKWLKEDNTRFRQAVEKAGGQVSPNFQTEPVNALARKFGADLSVAQAAAEVGLEVKAFQEGVRRSSKLAGLGFAQLLADDGGMKRDAWDDNFDAMTQELKLGDYLKPQHAKEMVGNALPPRRGPNRPVTFAPARQYEAPAVTDIVTAGRLDEDRWPDVVVAADKEIGVFYGQGNGVMMPYTRLVSWQAGVNNQEIADVNGDNRPDILFNDGLGRFVILFNLGRRRFDEPYFQNIGGISGIRAFDVNGDRRLDIIGSQGDIGVKIMLNDGRGTFRNYITVPQRGADGVAFRDVNGDRILDLAVSNYSSTQGGAGVTIYYGDPGGNFRKGPFYAIGSQSMPFPHLEDYNGDGKADLVQCDYWAGNIAVLLNNGDGTFQPATRYPASGYPFMVRPADFNGDGRLDMAIPSTKSFVLVYRNRGDGTFYDPESIPTGGDDCRSCFVIDFNLDGKPDIVTQNQATKTISILLNTTR